MADTVYCVNAGLGLATALLAASALKYVGWGTGTTQAAVGNTGLETASAEARTSGTQSQQQTNTANDTYQVVAAITSLSTQAITEVAIMSASEAGTCFVHGTFSAINVNASDSITFTIKVVLDQA